MHETAGFLEQDGARLAWRKVAGGGPTVVWLGGFHSEMTGTKGEALAVWAAETGRAYLRFDYFGHGLSEGRFEDGTISRWRGDALAVIDRLTTGPLVLVGSSMGGWLACLAALARPERIAGLVLIAPAADFTQALLAPRLPPEAHEALERDGQMDPSIAVRRRGLSDHARPARRRSAMVHPARSRRDRCPGPYPAGGPDVPWEHALSLARALQATDVPFSLIGDGDHRLSRPQDIRRLIVAIEEVASSW